MKKGTQYLKIHNDCQIALIQMFQFQVNIAQNSQIKAIWQPSWLIQKPCWILVTTCSLAIFSHTKLKIGVEVVKNNLYQIQNANQKFQDGHYS